MTTKPAYVELEQKIRTHFDGFKKFKQAKNMLAENEKQFRALIANIPGVVYRCKVDENWTMTFIGNEIETLTGYPAADFINNQKRSYSSILHPEDTKVTDKIALEAVDQKKSFIIEYRIMCSDGKWHWVQERGRGVFDDQEKVVYLDGVIFDITKRKQLEDLKQESDEKLKELNEELENKIKERTSSLEDVNTALRVLLKKREEDKNQIGENIYSNFKSLVQPFLNQLRNSHSKNTQKEILDILESSIKEMITPFSKKLSDPIISLTPTEIQVAGLVKDGKTNKEIAELLIKSIRAITSHREHIRQKLGLKNKKINLRTYLLSLN
jgi:PAS domain S-box-containing protein